MITDFTSALLYMENGLNGSIALLCSSIGIAGGGFMFGKGVPIGALPFFAISIFLTHYLYNLIGLGNSQFISGVSALFILTSIFAIFVEIIKGGRV